MNVVWPTTAFFRGQFTLRLSFLGALATQAKMHAAMGQREKPRQDRNASQHRVAKGACHRGSGCM